MFVLFASCGWCLLKHPCAGMLEIHLSHNMLTLAGATALLEALPAAGAAAAAAGGTSESAGEQQSAGEVAAAAEQAAGSSGEPAAASEVPSKPVWLRLEWNRISLGGLMQVRLGLQGYWAAVVASLVRLRRCHRRSSACRCIRCASCSMPPCNDCTML